MRLKTHQHKHISKRLPNMARFVCQFVSHLHHRRRAPHVWMGGVDGEHARPPVLSGKRQPNLSTRHCDAITPLPPPFLPQAGGLGGRSHVQQFTNVSLGRVIWYDPADGRGKNSRNMTSDYPKRIGMRQCYSHPLPRQPPLARMSRRGRFRQWTRLNRHRQLLACLLHPAPPLCLSPSVYTSGTVSPGSLQPISFWQRTEMLTRWVLALSPVSVKPCVATGLTVHHLGTR